MVNARLHPRTIEAVKERADIVDVVGEHVVLKKKGREYVGICPFHDDSKPSMTCLLYTSPSPRDGSISRMPSSA